MIPPPERDERRPVRSRIGADGAVATLALDGGNGREVREKDASRRALENAGSSRVATDDDGDAARVVGAERRRWARGLVVVEEVGVPRPNPRSRTPCVPVGIELGRL